MIGGTIHASRLCHAGPEAIEVGQDVLPNEYFVHLFDRIVKEICIMPQPFRFSVVISNAPSRAAIITLARRAAELR